MCLMFLVFFKDSYFKNIKGFLKSFKNGPIEVGIDENCGICKKFSRIIKKLDFYQLVIIDRAHNPESEKLQSVDKIKRLEAVLGYEKQEERFIWGMDVVSHVLYKLPFGFLLKPIFIALKFRNFDKKIYKRITHSKMRKNCSEGICRV